jgi:cytochrome P450
MTEPDTDFDHNAPEMVGGIYDVYRELRRRCPVAYSGAHGGFWIVSSYEEVSKVARDDVTFSSRRSGLVPPTDVGRLLPIMADPPELARYRALLYPFFSPAAVRKLEPFIRSMIDRCIDDFIKHGRADLVMDLANPVPAATTMHMLGLDWAEWRYFAEPLHAVMYSPAGSVANQAAQHAVQAFGQRIVDEIELRQRSPRDDMIGELLVSEYQGRRTEKEEVVDLVRMVIFGGMDTVVAALSNMFVQIGRRPDLRARLLADATLIPGAIEEFLRFEAPIQGFSRLATRDTEVGGRPIKAGETVFMLWGSANRDETVFGDSSEELILDRPFNRHMAFGVGAHHCIGSNVARAELRLALEQVLQWIPDFVVRWDELVEAETIGSSYGRQRVPVEFEPRRRITNPAAP